MDSLLSKINLPQTFPKFFFFQAILFENTMTSFAEKLPYKPFIRQVNNFLCFCMSVIETVFSFSGDNL